MQVRDVMTTRVITVGPDTEVAEIARCLLENRISAVPVVETDGRLVGVVSEGDLMRRSESGTEPHFLVAIPASASRTSCNRLPQDARSPCPRGDDARAHYGQ